MITLYRFLGVLLYPTIVIIIYLRRFFGKEDPKRFTEKIFPYKFNIVKNIPDLIWFHAASIGELRSIHPIIEELKNINKDYQFLITTTTLSSSKLVNKEFKNIENIYHRFLPIDVSFVIKSFLKNWKPKAIFLVDSEIWPNLILYSRELKIPLALINARITKKTSDKWMLFNKTANKIFSSIDLCLASNNETKKKLIDLKAKKVFFTGNIKLISKIDQNKIENTNKEFLEKEKFWLAASTHSNEEEFCLAAHKKLKEHFKKITTIIAPRHISRSKQIQNMCNKLNLSNQILNDNDIILKEKEIIIINSFGVLPSYFKYAKSTFIGKSFIKRLEKEGGQNPIEAAKLGCKVYHGPFVYNFSEIYQLLGEKNISKKIESSDELVENLKSDLNENEKKKFQFDAFLNDLGASVLINNMEKINKFLKNEI